jgi:hypothetical protein
MSCIHQKVIESGSVSFEALEGQRWAPAKTENKKERHYRSAEALRHPKSASPRNPRWGAGTTSTGTEAGLVFGALYAAVKRRSSTTVDAFVDTLPAGLKPNRWRMLAARLKPRPFKTWSGS